MKHNHIALLLILFTIPVFSQWEPIGPYGGYIRCLIKDNLGRVLSGNAYGGIFRTSDAGKNWEQLFTGYRNEDVRSLAVNANNHLFAGTDLRGLYRSTNDGVSWERLINSVSTRSILDILIKSNGDIFLGTFDGVYRSTDNGNTFTPANNGITTSSIYSLGLSGDYLFAGTGNAGVFRSSDEGANWEAVNNGINLSDGIILGFASAEKTVNAGVAEIHALTQNNLYHSTNSGVNWEELSPPTGLYLDALLKNNSNIVVAGDKILNSTDQGNSWNTYNSPTGALISSVIEINEDTLMIGTQGPGTYVSINTLTDWNIVINKMPATAITNISATAGVINVSTRHSGVFSSSDNGLNWSNLSSSIPNGWFYGLYQHPTTNTLFALHQNGVYRSINSGADWNLTSAFGKTMVFNSLGNIFLGSGSYISKSTDDGVSFQLKQIDPNVFNSRQIAIDQNDEMIVATANDFGLQGQGVYRSIDLGETYFPYNDGLPNDITSVESVDTTGFSSQLECVKKFLAVDANGNFYSNNEDGSWNQFNIGFQQGGLVKDIASVNYTEGIDISVISEQVEYKLDPGINCTFFIEPNIENDEILNNIEGIKFQFDKTNSQFTYLIGTIGNSVIKKVYLTEVNDETDDLPVKFKLSQNYPNPFNPGTKISWQSSVSGWQTLKIYDVLGNEITKLVDEFREAGRYEIEFDASHLSSGIYFYKFQAGSFVETKKMILMR